MRRLPVPAVDGSMFQGSCCRNAYCEDHLPAEARFLEPFERIDSTYNGFQFQTWSIGPLFEAV